MSRIMEPMVHLKPQRRSWLVHLHFAAFLILLIGWTVALLRPIPRQTAAVVLPTEDAQFWFGKCMHVGIYAFLTITGISLPLSRRQRLALVIGFFCHGAGTEIGQLYVPGRTGTLRDVILDSIGITIGWGVWTWWNARFASKENQPTRNQDSQHER